MCFPERIHVGILVYMFMYYMHVCTCIAIVFCIVLHYAHSTLFVRYVATCKSLSSQELSIHTHKCTCMLFNNLLIVTRIPHGTSFVLTIP